MTGSKGCTDKKTKRRSEEELKRIVEYRKRQRLNGSKGNEEYDDLSRIDVGALEDRSKRGRPLYKVQVEDLGDHYEQEKQPDASVYGPPIRQSWVPKEIPIQKQVKQRIEDMNNMVNTYSLALCEDLLLGKRLKYKKRNRKSVLKASSLDIRTECHDAKQEADGKLLVYGGKVEDSHEVEEEKYFGLNKGNFVKMARRSLRRTKAVRAPTKTQGLIKQTRALVYSFEAIDQHRRITTQQVKLTGAI